MLENLKILIAMDSFKGSASSKQVEELVEEGILRVEPDAEIIKIPVADGGEGTVDALAEALGGKIVTMTVSDPLGRRVKASYAIVKDTAVIEMAAASGLALLGSDEADALLASSYGTGEMILHAVRSGLKKIILGIGGSATTDAGMGALCAMGVRFYDDNGNMLCGSGRDLAYVSSIDDSGLDPKIKEAKIYIACDVTNLLYGPNGAAYVYAPQKGATPSMVKRLDDGLRRFDRVVAAHTKKQLALQPGMGAAGGLGYGLCQFLAASMRQGADLILDEIGIEKYISDCDFVITGEGCIDHQTRYGKLPNGVAMRAKKHGKPVFAICGCEAPGGEGAVYAAGIDEAVSCIYAPCSVQEAIENTRKNIARAAERLMRIIKAARSMNIAD